jgi:hypothetical protein
VAIFSRYTSHVMRHTSHVTRHTSHVTRHTSCVMRHTSHVTRHTSHVTRHTSHVTRHTSHVTRHTSQACIVPSQAILLWAGITLHRSFQHPSVNRISVRFHFERHRADHSLLQFDSRFVSVEAITKVWRELNGGEPPAHLLSPVTAQYAGSTPSYSAYPQQVVLHGCCCCCR